MWIEVVTTGMAAIAGGALVVPAAENSPFGNVKRDWLAGEIELDRIEPTDGQTVRLKDGGLFRVIHLRGVNYDAKILDQQEAMLQARSKLQHQLGALGLTTWYFGVKRLRDISFTAEWPSLGLSEIGEAERKAFQSSYYVDWYLVIGGRRRQALVDGCSKIKAAMPDYRPRIVTKATEPGQACELTGFLNYLLSGEYRTDLPSISSSLSGSLPGADPDFALDGTITMHVPAKKLHRVVAVREWPENVQGRLLADILAIRGDLEVCQICEPWDRDGALLQLARRQRELDSAIFGNSEMLAECKALIQLLTKGDTTIFYAQLQVVCRADDEVELARIVAEVCEALGRRQVVHSIETHGAATAWFARIPKLPRRRVINTTQLQRPLVLRDQNIMAVWPLHHSSTGMLEGPFGPRPVRFFRTPSGQAYAFQFHVVAERQTPGNFLVMSPTGGGKSTVIAHLLGGLAKFAGVRSYLFDSKEGARYMVESMGGLYMGYDELQMNPLDVGEDTKKNRQRVYHVLRSMAGNYERGENDDAAFNHALELAFRLDPPERTLNAIYEFAFERRTGLRRAFAPWVVDGKGVKGIRSHLMNAPRDTLGSVLSASHLVGINMNEALDDPDTGPPVVTHISSAVGQSGAESSNGFAIFVDEAAKLSTNEGFKLLMMEMYREYRKNDGFVGLAYQDPKALFDSGIGDAVLENTATFIFLPNSQANKAGLERFNLNDEQIAFILGSGDRKEGERRVLIVKRDAARGIDESAIVDVSLSFLGDALRYYRAGKAANHDLAELKRLWGPLWQQHL